MAVEVDPSVASGGSLGRVSGERRQSSAAMMDRRECPLWGRERPLLRRKGLGWEKGSVGSVDGRAWITITGDVVDPRSTLATWSPGAGCRAAGGYCAMVLGAAGRRASAAVLGRFAGDDARDDLVEFALVLGHVGVPVLGRAWVVGLCCGVERGESPRNTLALRLASIDKSRTLL
jgi:hypothetical protein